MNVMRVIVLIATFLTTSSLSIAQAEEWMGGLVKLGYRHSFDKVDAYALDNGIDNNGQSQFQYTQANFNQGHTTFGIRGFMPHFHLDMDISLLPLLLHDLVDNKQSKIRKNRILKDPDTGTPLSNPDGSDVVMTGVDRQIFNTRLAFGGYIKDKFGIFAGGQYNYNEIQLKNVNTDYTTRYGGHHWGISTHLIVPTSFMLVKYTGLYDWIKTPKNFPPQGRQNSLTNELTLEIGLSSDKELTFYVIGSHKMFMSKAVYSEDGNHYIRPKFTGTQWSIQAGLCMYLTGLGTSRQTIVTLKVID